MNNPCYEPRYNLTETTYHSLCTTVENYSIPHGFPEYMLGLLMFSLAVSLLLFIGLLTVKTFMLVGK